MNQIEQAYELPDWKWMAKSQQEMILTGHGLIDQTDFMWKVGKVAVVGFVYQSLVSPPWMWFALAETVTVGDLIDFRRLARLIPKGTLTGVEAGFSVGLRFAKLYGFEEVGKETDYFGQSYKIMRRV